MTRQTDDVKHLHLLSVFHYVVGALTALFACFPIIHLVIGIIALTSPEAFAGKDGTPPPALFGWLFVLIGGGLILLGWTVAVILVIAGRFLARKAHYTFCFITACIACALMPFGTALGVFTVIVLSRPSVKELFSVQQKDSSSAPVSP